MRQGLSAPRATSGGLPVRRAEKIGELWRRTGSSRPGGRATFIDAKRYLMFRLPGRGGNQLVGGVCPVVYAFLSSLGRILSPLSRWVTFGRRPEWGASLRPGRLDSVATPRSPGRDRAAVRACRQACSGERVPDGRGGVVVEKGGALCRSIGFRKGCECVRAGMVNRNANRKPCRSFIGASWDGVRNPGEAVSREPSLMCAASLCELIGYEHRRWRGAARTRGGGMPTGWRIPCGRNTYSAGVYPPGVSRSASRSGVRKALAP